ncbi:type III pantothenate kinase [Neiella marina]|uniref:Type III pantothenate kinase n=1 Tax=Neiella holothuriorum TaxID=2870530 RepID=A0ABS7EH44_9GAMM|nr:type III pantothenate kinase [Neiella holothuriorum]MBW8191659.1 type III pantothenate kinase [Neiella holothuriorum]
MLLIDLGNTRGKLVEIDNGRLQPPIYWDYQQPFADVWSTFKGKSISLICLACVAPGSICQQVINVACQQQITVREVNSEPQAFGVTNGYHDHTLLGVDRWLGLIGARQLTKQACVIVDAGTAVTVDAMDASGYHLGGWIVPGLQMMQESLTQRSEKLHVHKQQRASGFGLSTSDAIQLGALSAIAGAITQAMKLIALPDHESQGQLILTGGDADKLASFMDVEVFMRPDLVFTGLKRYAEDAQRENQ